MRAIIIIPTDNERDNIKALVEKLLRESNDLHLLIVEDNSPDCTGHLAEGLSLNNSGRVFVLHGQKKEGLRRAYAPGLKCVLQRGYDVILQMDPKRSSRETRNA